MKYQTLSSTRCGRLLLLCLLLLATPAASPAEALSIVNADFSGRAADGSLVGWQSTCFFQTPPPEQSLQQEDRAFVRFHFPNANPRRGIVWSLAQPIAARPASDQDFVVTVRFRVSADIPLYAGITSGQGCALPYVRARLPLQADESGWSTATVRLSGFRFQPSNVIWKGALWLEIFIVGRAETLPLTIDLAEVRVAIEPSQIEATSGGEPLCIDAPSDALTFYEINPVSNHMILSDATTLHGRRADSIQVRSARGAIVPVGLVVSGKAKQLLPVVEAFENNDGKIGIDIKVVKSWYQDRNENWRLHPPAFDLPPPSERAIPINTDPQSYQYSPMERTGLKLLTPELLLNDENLIVVDEKTRNNFVRAGLRRLRLDDPASAAAVTIDDFAVADSERLLPVDMSDGRLRQYWIDIDVPASVPPGLYQTKIQWFDGDELLAQTPLTIDVLPVTLPETEFIAGIYYHPVNYTNEPGYPVFYPGEKAWDQTAREFESLSRNRVSDAFTPGPRHNVGVDTPVDADDLMRRIELRKSAGLRTDRLFYTGIMLGQIHTAEQAENLRRQIRLLVQTARSSGVQDIYVYSLDEASAEALAALRSAWQIAHEEGAKIFAAGSREDMFPTMGDMLDLFICAGYPDRREAARWHAAGGKIACYANPQGGLEQPETYRRNYGILLWQHDYDGAAPYTYHTAGRQSVGSVPSLWNDYIANPDSMKQHAMAYPTASGVIETIQLRGLREAYTDLQYLRALEIAINEKSLSSDVASSAFEWLRVLKSGDINKDQTDPADVRARIVEFLSDIRKETPP